MTITELLAPKDVQRVVTKLNEAGHDAYVVRSGYHEVEVTTYRIEANYADHRRPDHVAFTDSLKEDLSRRDFTMNAMAWRPGKDGTGGELGDPFGGQSDLDAHLLRAVGDPEDRF